MQLINVGFGNIVVASRIVAIVSPESAPIKRIIQDAKENKIVVPAGFKIIEGATTVDKGIVIEDVTETATKGSQFVWIPVGTIIKSDGTTATITLGRYDFNSTTGVESAYTGTYVEEDANDTSTLKKYGNIIAKNIRTFKNSVATNGGYYIGRYEARTATARNAAGNALTQITEKGTAYITDLGMTGPINSVIGMGVEESVKRFVTSLPERYKLADGNCMLNGCIFEVNDENCRVMKINRIIRK